jgi:hypothetical protein
MQYRVIFNIFEEKRIGSAAAIMALWLNRNNHRGSIERRSINPAAGIEEMASASGCGNMAGGGSCRGSMAAAGVAKCAASAGSAYGEMAAAAKAKVAQRIKWRISCHGGENVGENQRRKYGKRKRNSSSAYSKTPV